VAIVTQDRGAWASAPSKMGLAALAARRLPPKNRCGGGMTELLEQINALISAPARDLDTIERTLTDGYAHALSLEAETWRLEKRIKEVAQTLQRGDTAKKARELASLAERVEGSVDDLATLRSVLADLRRHADAVRVSL
jgi:predicted  nucleic acid-binding Zn-ribbon protein